ncbi:hypothetical protein B0T19DRAFT_66725 [Cercophora scortea]|uniref:Uncharacterized protein n=1 Tax=Cercophora scortea TaxID=314031 RepID=A0AAE0J5E6_9PEZI|nr:hypothetical protein B0T19DRAFT_66725 [Cercophora scortea]
MERVWTTTTMAVHLVRMRSLFSQSLFPLCIDLWYCVDTPISPSLKTPTSARSRRKSSLALKRSPLSPSSPGPRSATFAPGSDAGDAADDDNDNDGDDDFGDDFDDFEEGGDGDDGDFGDFDDGDFQQVEDASIALVPESAPPPTAPPPQPQSNLPFPIPDFEDLDAGEIFAVTEPYLDALFPSPDDTPLISASKESNPNPIFLTTRSASLWSQLVAPPPLQPPDWIRSRIRRLFLVSLGVPVDLDEILPASTKAKKLVLPSLHLRRVGSSGSLSTSRSRSLSRVRQSGANASTTSVDSQGNPKAVSSTAAAAAAAAGATTKATGTGTSALQSKSSANSTSAANQHRKGPPPEPAFDLVAAKQLCMTTDEALQGMTDAELRAHVAKLQAMEGTAGEVLVYWQKRTDEKIGDREAFEGVIENLVKHARKVRK